ncbi:MAG: hypothetical protein QW459_02340 [Sulfolobales archaeon]
MSAALLTPKGLANVLGVYDHFSMPPEASLLLSSPSLGIVPVIRRYLGLRL